MDEILRDDSCRRDSRRLTCRPCFERVFHHKDVLDYSITYCYMCGGRDV